MRKSTILITLGICLVLCQGLLPIGAYIAAYFLPREYTSTVTLEVKSEIVMRNITGGEVDGIAGPYFRADQLQIILSKGILYPVIDELGLVEKWSVGLPAKLTREQAYNKLIQMIKVSQKKNTDLLTVAVTSPDRQQAADIANTIADIYQKRRRDDLAEIIYNALSEFRVRLDDQQRKVDQAAAELNRIRQRDDKEAESNMLRVEAKLNEAKQRVEELKSQVSKFDQMSFEEIISSSLTILSIPDATIAEIAPKYVSARAEEARLIQSGVGEDDPRIKNLRAQEAVWKKQLTDEIDSDRKNLHARLDVAQNYLDGEQKIYDEAKSRTQENRPMYDTEYVTAEQNYFDAETLFSSIGQKSNSKGAELQTELAPPQIVEKTEPARFPSSPNVTVILIASITLGFLFAAGGVALLIIGLRMKSREA